jgi:hypothetical protein
MYSQNKTIIFSLLILTGFTIYGQNEKKRNNNSVEIGFNLAGKETVFYGIYGKYSMPLSQRRHHPTMSLTLMIYNDFKGESTSEAYLINDIDMRIIPSLNLGYSVNFKKIQLNLEAQIGSSIAITEGTLVNQKIGFERDYSNEEIFWHYGLSFSPKYRINKLNQIGIFTFVPLVLDKAQSGYQLGIGWTKTFD